MSNFSASVPVNLLQATNNALQALGHGPNNFSIPAYAAPTATFAVLYAWSDAAFEADVAAQLGVVLHQGWEPDVLTTLAATNVGTKVFLNAPPLTGVVTPGLYRQGVGISSVLWYVIQGYNTATYPDPTVIPALIRLAKIPGQALPWVQPLDQFDAYKLVNPFTGKGDLCTHNGQEWYVTQADGAGNNIWEPGVFGWTVVGQAAKDYITYNSDPVFYGTEGVTYG